MSLVAIGPVAIDHGDPKFNWTSSPTAHGIRTCTIGGSCSFDAVKQLSELVNGADPADRRTVGGRTGILEYIEFDDDLLDDLSGYYLLEGFGFDAEQQHSLAATDVPFSLTAAYLGDLP